MEASELAGIGHNMPPKDIILPGDLPPLDGQSLLDRLQVNHKATVAEVEALAKKANEVKALVDAAEAPDEFENVKGLNDELVAKMTEVGGLATKMATAIKTERLATTKPLREEVDEINGFFNTMETRVVRIKDTFATKVGAYESARKAQESREAAERAKKAQEEADKKLAEAEAAGDSVMGDVLLNEAVKAEQEAQMAASAAVKAGVGPTHTGGGTISQSTKWTFDIIDTDKIPLDALRPYIKLADFEKYVRAYVAAHKNTKPLAGVNIRPDTKTSFR